MKKQALPIIFIGGLLVLLFLLQTFLPRLFVFFNALLFWTFILGLVYFLFPTIKLHLLSFFSKKKD